MLLYINIIRDFLSISFELARDVQVISGQKLRQIFNDFYLNTSLTWVGINEEWYCDMKLLHQSYYMRKNILISLVSTAIRIERSY